MSNRTILFADDSATMRTIVEKTFAAEQFKVVSVPSGEAAILKSREIRPDIVIADIGMAGVSGYDICKAMRKDPELRDIPVIIMGGVSNPYDEMKGIEAEVTEYMKKPFDTTELIEKVKELASSALERDDHAEEIDSSLLVDETSREMAVPKPSGGGLYPEKPAVAPTGPSPIFSPMGTKPSTKETMAFGRSVIADDDKFYEEPPEEEPLSEETADILDEPSDQWLQKTEAAPEPIEIGDREDSSSSASFQVSTLAELAQIDEEGETIPTGESEDAIELSTAAIRAEEPSRLIQPTAEGLAYMAPSHDLMDRAARDVAKKAAGRIVATTPDQKAAVEKMTLEVIERVVWEVVPDLAETIIKEEIAKLLKE